MLKIGDVLDKKTAEVLLKKDTSAASFLLNIEVNIAS